jgi:hypothetical protein
MAFQLSENIPSKERVQSYGKPDKNAIFAEIFSKKYRT